MDNKQDTQTLSSTVQTAVSRKHASDSMAAGNRKQAAGKRQQGIRQARKTAGLRPVPLGSFMLLGDLLRSRNQSAEQLKYAVLGKPGRRAGGVCVNPGPVVKQFRVAISSLTRENLQTQMDRFVSRTKTNSINVDFLSSTHCFLGGSVSRQHY